MTAPAMLDDALQKAAEFGQATSANGARLYGHVPHVAPQAWFHIVYPGLDDAALAALEEKLGRPVPPVYREFLRWSNGLHLFSGALSLYGLRRDYSRRLDVREPADLSTPNVVERPTAAAHDWFIVGFYKADGSSAYIDVAGSRLYRASRDMSEPRLNEWDDFDRFLSSEVERLAGHFDDRGQRLRRDQPTTPPPRA